MKKMKFSVDGGFTWYPAEEMADHVGKEARKTYGDEAVDAYLETVKAAASYKTFEKKGGILKVVMEDLGETALFKSW